MGTNSDLKKVVKRKREETSSELSSVMMDILQTKVDDVDSVILAKGEKSIDMVSPALKKRKTNTDKVDGNSDNQQSVLKKHKKTLKLEKAKPKKKTEQTNVITSDVDDGAECFANDSEACSGLADVMSKILNKRVKTTNVILAKCETDKQRVLKTTKVKSSTDEQRSKNGEEASAVSQHQRVLKRKEWDQMGRLKPSVLEKERERNLQRIATKGVVQLFNAVQKQQAILEVKVKDAGATESKREKAVHSLTKGHFLDMLKTTKNEQKSVDVKLEPIDADSVADAAPTWSVLRDDFMAGATMKDWDKEEENSD